MKFLITTAFFLITCMTNGLISLKKSGTSKTIIESMVSKQR